MQCDMRRECKAIVTHIGEKGYIYCQVHGVERRHSGYESTRKMRPWELKIVAAGQPLPSYYALKSPNAAESL